MKSLTFTFFSSLTFLISIVSANTVNTVNFTYSGTTGPAFWDVLPGSSEICRVGKHQSPIDISLDEFKRCSGTVNANFSDAHNVEVRHNGNTIEVSKEGGLPANLTIVNRHESYELIQFHFHTPSEHRLDGKHYDMEAHFVFMTKDEKPKISVVGVFYNMGKESEFLKPIVEALPLKNGERKEIEYIKLSSILSDINFLKKAYTYSGSLTTPPCTEGVTWWVNRPVLTLSLSQFSALRDVIGFNSRFTQVNSADHRKKGNLSYTY